MDDPPKPARRQPPVSSRFVNRNDSADLERRSELRLGSIGRSVFASLVQDLELWLDDLQSTAVLVSFDLPVECEELSRLELVTQIGRVEPDAFQASPALPRGHLE